VISRSSGNHSDIITSSKSAAISKAEGIEKKDGTWKGLGPPLLVATDLFKRNFYNLDLHPAKAG
jgi:hypothetical protein